MELKELAKSYGEAEFAEKLCFILLLSQYDLPLEDFCDGGMIEKVEKVVIDDVTDDAETIYADFRVSFVESRPSSCADYNHKYDRLAFLSLTIDKKSGKTEFKGSHCDTEEF